MLGAVAVMDAVLFALLVVAFAALATVHLSLLFRLAFRRPRWRSLVALALPPLAPIWGFREGMRLSAGLWVSALLVYIATRIAAS